jgi:hypothetical protein
MTRPMPNSPPRDPAAKRPHRTRKAGRLHDRVVVPPSGAWIRPLDVLIASPLVVFASCSAWVEMVQAQ